MTLECVPKCTCIEGYAWLDEECAEIDSTKCGKLYVAPIEKWFSQCSDLFMSFVLILSKFNDGEASRELLLLKNGVK